METFLLVLHPIIQGFAVLLGIYAMWQGWKRVEMTVLKKKIIFPWRSHVHCGTIAMILWLLGGLGFYTTTPFLAKLISREAMLILHG